MDQDNKRTYDTFSKEAIRNSSGHNSLNGWVNGSTDGYNNDATPLDADNLNAMLNMIIQIRDVIGTTDKYPLKTSGKDGKCLKDEIDAMIAAAVPPSAINGGNADYFKRLEESNDG